eukprot:TRINITY_DN18_c0_g1_i1.p1 TRINITY_DN18_c0_g1~~TRINITY_DN18_c0_g1_i1.p1  ORF type:complete len:234 (+),score=63.48 TRINITY_DN18_c0_g1_i1:294-995(+)
MKQFMLATAIVALFFVLAQCQTSVPPTDKECTGQCSGTNYTCCGCCSSGSSCTGNLISKKCCPITSQYCGCISNRAFCSGSVYGETNQGDTFGTCYDAASGATCDYNPGPNLWIVCPAGYSSCQSSSFFSCCGPDQVCTTSQFNSTPVCAPKISSGVPQDTQPTEGGSNGQPVEPTSAAPVDVSSGVSSGSPSDSDSNNNQNLGTVNRQQNSAPLAAVPLTVLFVLVGAVFAA